MSEEQVEELEEEYGFDKPIIQAYLQWLWNSSPGTPPEQVEVGRWGRTKWGVLSAFRQHLGLLKGSGRQAKVSHRGW